jgi:hypothetical protein
MIRRIFSLILITTFISACGNSGKKEVVSSTKGSEPSVKVEFATLIENPDNYVGKNIIVEGKVIHVCTKTGKKMFIVGDNPDISLYVAAGENISKFPMELLGSEVVVEGLITRVGGTEMTANEKPVKKTKSLQAAEGVTKSMTSDSCETETALAGQPSLSNIIMEYKSHTVK